MRLHSSQKESHSEWIRATDFIHRVHKKYTYIQKLDSFKYVKEYEKFEGVELL